MQRFMLPVNKKSYFPPPCIISCLGNSLYVRARIVAHDITDRKKAEQELPESEMKFRIFAEIFGGVCICKGIPAAVGIGRFG